MRPRSGGSVFAAVAEGASDTERRRYAAQRRGCAGCERQVLAWAGNAVLLLGLLRWAAAAGRRISLTALRLRLPAGAL
jgi:hypothetical protein